jgi:hypothetical protein
MSNTAVFETRTNLQSINHVGKRLTVVGFDCLKERGSSYKPNHMPCTCEQGPFLTN